VISNSSPLCVPQKVPALHGSCAHHGATVLLCSSPPASSSNLVIGLLRARHVAPVLELVRAHRVTPIRLLHTRHRSSASSERADVPPPAPLTVLLVFLLPVACRVVLQLHPTVPRVYWRASLKTRGRRENTDGRGSDATSHFLLSCFWEPLDGE
jgi:hypothetical protein